jgi:hypothetical protein
MSTLLKNKDNLILSNDYDILFQPVVQKCKDGQGGEEIHIEKPHNGLEIVEQSALDHFKAVLQKAPVGITFIIILRAIACTPAWTMPGTIMI